MENGELDDDISREWNTMIVTKKEWNRAVTTDLYNFFKVLMNEESNMKITINIIYPILIKVDKQNLYMYVCWW